MNLFRYNSPLTFIGDAAFVAIVGSVAYAAHNAWLTSILIAFVLAMFWTIHQERRGRL